MKKRMMRCMLLVVVVNNLVTFMFYSRLKWRI